MPVRLLSIADTLDAMTSDRPYRPGLSFDVATKEIVKNTGTQFDPEAVKAFLARADTIESLLKEMGKLAPTDLAELASLEKVA